MDNEIKNELLDQINFMLESSPEELYRIFLYSFSTFLKSIIKFGLNSNQAKDSIKVLTDFTKILKEENNLLKIIKKNINKIDLENCIDIIESLDLLNDNTYLSLIEILDNINISYEMNDKNRIYKSNKEIDTLITNSSYKEKVLKLIKETP